MGQSVRTRVTPVNRSMKPGAASWSPWLGRDHCQCEWKEMCHGGEVCLPGIISEEPMVGAVVLFPSQDAVMRGLYAWRQLAEYSEHVSLGD